MASYEIDIKEINKIDGGLEVFATATKDGNPIGFGVEGTIETERFRIINPPILVPDGTSTTTYDAENDFDIVQPNFVENPEQALQEVLGQIVAQIAGDRGEYSNEPIPGTIGQTTTTVYPDDGTGGGGTHDGKTQKTGTGASRYTTARDAATADSAADTTSTENSPRWDERGATTGFTIDRCQYVFDTSAIGNDSISSATYSVYVNSEGRADDSLSLALVSGAPASDDAAAVGDYDSFGTTHFSDDVDPAAVPSYQDFGLNADGVAHIDGSGNTAFMLMYGNDVDDSGLPSGRNYVNTTFADNAGTTNDPKLVVEHAAPTNPGTTDMVAHYELGESSGTRADSFASYDLATTTSATQGTGIQGNCIDCESSSSQTVGTNSGLGFDNATPNITLIGWVKPGSAPTSGNLVTICAGPRNGTAYTGYHQMYYQNNSGTLRLLWTRQGNNFNNSAGYDVTLPTDSWSHVALTYDGTDVKGYLNGLEVISFTSTTVGTGDVGTSFYLGSNVATGLYYDGLIDEWSVYNEALSAGQIAWLYNDGSGRTFSEIEGSGAVADNALSLCNF